jgi:hypothetical protein
MTREERIKIALAKPLHERTDADIDALTGDSAMEYSAALLERDQARLMAGHHPVEASDVGALLEALAERAARQLEFQLNTGPTLQAKASAARLLLDAWLRMRKDQADVTGARANETDGQREERAYQLFKSGPPVVRRALLRWMKDEQGRS